MSRLALHTSKILALAIGVGSCAVFGVELAASGSSNAGPSALASQPAGYRHLLENAYVPAQLDQEIFDNLWKTWEAPLKAKAEQATPEERRQMAFSRYGLTEAPGREGGMPLQYADNGKGGWVLNCFACHGGKVAGQVIMGAPNTHIALETLFQEIYSTKRQLNRPVPPAELGSLVVPLGKSNGTTNAIIFGVVLGAYRDRDLNVHPEYPTPKMVHHDHDAPPWWHMKRKTHLYADGFAGKGHRALMQFMMVFSNGPEVFHQAEDEYKDIYAWIESLEPPKYPFAIDEQLAGTGREVFNKNCAQCHGHYGDGSAFPQKIVSIDEVGTDRARLDSLSYAQRKGYEESWFSNHGEKKSICDPQGYVAQPLDGIWASAPYLHNGAVPTLWHMFHSDQRPTVWKRTEDGYDANRVGLEVTELSSIPAEVTSAKEKRTYFDTRLFGKSAEGHTFPDALSEDEKTAVMEYLKTL